MLVRGSTMKVLITEDDAVSRMHLEKVLKKLDFEVITAYDGNGAWELLQKPGAPRLVILDRMMPGLGGVEICRRLRRMETDDMSYIILLTAFDSKEDIVEGLDAGANDYVVKPFDHEELRARIKVGQRVVELQRAFIERKKLSGAIEMAGAVCHDFNQPLQVIMGYTDMLLMNITSASEQWQKINEIKKSTVKLGKLTRKLQQITLYKTKDYIGTTKIIDIDRASVES
jgi:DNA-binding response OmpR family regulator